MEWFEGSLARATEAGLPPLAALVTTLKSWFSEPDFRGCAFLNAAAELGSSDQNILATVRPHKQGMSSVVDDLFKADAQLAGRAVSVVIDGAIVHAQMGQSVDDVIGALEAVVSKTLAH